MRRKKKNESIWHYLTVGFGEFTMPKIKLWYEIVPGFAFKAIWFGRQRKGWFIGKQYLVLYRDNIEEKCIIEWIPISQLTRRDLNNYIDKHFDLNCLPATKNAFIHTNTDL